MSTETENTTDTPRPLHLLVSGHVSAEHEDTTRLNFLENYLKQTGVEQPHLCFDHHGIGGKKYFELVQPQGDFTTDENLRCLLDAAMKDAR